MLIPKASQQLNITKTARRTADFILAFWTGSSFLPNKCAARESGFLISLIVIGHVVSNYRRLGMAHK